jgi:hypothetical protein
VSAADILEEYIIKIFDSNLISWRGLLLSGNP